MNTKPKFAMGIPLAPQVTYVVSSRATPYPVTGAQIQKALQVCRDLAQVYATADLSNGGSQHMRWEALDEIAGMAEDALGADGLASVIEAARQENGFEDENFYVEHNGDHWQSVFPSHCSELSQNHSSPEDAIAYIKSEFPKAEPIVRGEPQPAANDATQAPELLPGERKKSDDTEGGACD